MSFPPTGHSLLSLGDWLWKKAPALAAVQAGFATVSAQIVVRRERRTAMPAVFTEGRQLRDSDFSGGLSVPVPDGRFHLQQPVIVETVHDHETYDLTWIGIADGQGITPSSVSLAFPAFSGLMLVESFSMPMSRRSVELPDGDVYAGVNLLPSGAAELNPATNQPQRTTLMLKTYARNYTGKCIATTDTLPEPTCNGMDIDTDGGINLRQNTNPASVRIRRAYWWPGKSGQGYAWILNSFTPNLLSSHGGVMLFEWSAEFILVHEWDF